MIFSILLRCNIQNFPSISDLLSAQKFLLNVFAAFKKYKSWITKVVLREQKNSC